MGIGVVELDGVAELELELYRVVDRVVELELELELVLELQPDL